MDSLTDFRKMKDEFYKNDQQSPLSPDQKSNFNGLDYFSENKNLRLEIDIEKFPEQEKLQMQTSTGDVQTYTKYGRFKFRIEDQEAELTLYASQHGYFLPFVDSQAGEITYGAGRYLDPEQLPTGKFVVDFNLAYNPYCAYNEAWSCPIPPAENRLSLPIKAGEKNYHN